MSNINPEVERLAKSLFDHISDYAPTADLSTWGYNKTMQGAMTHEVLEGTFAVQNVPSTPEGFSIYLNFTVATTNIRGWNQTILSETSRAYMHTADFSESSEIGEVSVQIGDLWSKRTLEDCINWCVGDAVFILETLLSPAEE